MRAYRWALRLFPRRFRERFGGDMAELFQDEWRVARRRGRLFAAILLLRRLVGAAAHAAAEHGRAFSWSPRMLLNDARQAWRLMIRQRAFSLIIIGTVALGVAATTAVFAVAEALILQPLPYEHAERLVRLFEEEDVEGFSGNVALGNLDDWCGIDAFESCGAFTSAVVNLAGGDSPERVRGAAATTGFLSTLGATPVRGRFFSETDVREQAPVVVVAEAAASRLFGNADPIGRSLLLDGVQWTVIGVAPALPGFDDIAVWRGVGTRGQSRQNHANRGIARLKPGVPALVARTQLEVVSRRLQQEAPGTNAHWWGRVEPLQQSLTEPFKPAIVALGLLTGVLLLLCAASAASLTAGRSAARGRELAVRLALGADRARLISQLSVESLALALAGSLVGAGLAALAIRGVTSVLPASAQLWRAPAVDLGTLAFAVVVAAGVSLIFGLMPAIVMTRTKNRALRQDMAPRSSRWLRPLLTALQTALATILLSSAALLAFVLGRAVLQDPGFRPDNVLTFAVSAPRSQYATPASLELFFGGIQDRLSRRPEVASIGAVMNPPAGGTSVIRGVIRVGEPVPPRGQARLVRFQVSTPGYLPAIGLRLIDGRDFNAADHAAAEPVTIINEKLATLLWPGERAVGQQLLVHTDEKTPRRVIGVIADARQARLDEAVTPEHYVPFAQAPRRLMTFVMRVKSELARADLQREVAAVDPTIPVFDVSTLEASMRRSGAPRRTITNLAGAFGLLSLLLAALALYGLVSAGVAERRREFGVRMALGASESSLLKTAAKRGLVMAAAGTALGLLATLPAARVLRSLLGSEPAPLGAVLAIVAVSLLAVSAIACLLPARSAARVDPLAALRSE